MNASKKLFDVNRDDANFEIDERIDDAYRTQNRTYVLMNDFCHAIEENI